jgi:hypothetical protein
MMDLVIPAPFHAVGGRSVSFARDEEHTSLGPLFVTARMPADAPAVSDDPHGAVPGKQVISVGAD